MSWMCQHCGHIEPYQDTAVGIECPRCGHYGASREEVPETQPPSKERRMRKRDILKEIVKYTVAAIILCVMLLFLWEAAQENQSRPSEQPDKVLVQHLTGKVGTEWETRRLFLDLCKEHGYEVAESDIFGLSVDVPESIDRRRWNSAEKVREGRFDGKVTLKTNAGRSVEVPIQVSIDKSEMFLEVVPEGVRILTIHFVND